jgi:hypothetical protein
MMHNSHKRTATHPDAACLTCACLLHAACCCLPLPADPPAGDVGSNAQEAACPAPPSATLTVTGSGYAYGQALTVLGSISPAVAGLKVWGQLALPAAVLSAECVDVTQVGFMTRVPASLKVGTPGTLRWLILLACRGDRVPLTTVVRHTQQWHGQACRQMVLHEL